MTNTAILITVLLFLFLNAFPVSGKDEPRISGKSGKAPYNFVVFLTDDQRWDTLWSMPILQEKLVKRGVTFTDAFVSTPICCPSRASLLSGGFYAKNTGVLDNYPPNGGVEKFKDVETLPALLWKRGYQTALIGRYLLGYQRIAPYIPPGWSLFAASLHEYHTRPSWVDYDILVGSSGAAPSRGKTVRITGQYKTDFQKDQALKFVNNCGESPFFLYLSFDAPHLPLIPAARDQAFFSGYRYRGRSVEEKDLEDKPAWKEENLNTDQVDDLNRAQLRGLQAVDRAVGAIVDKIEQMGKLEQTVFIFTSDNGMLWGEHGIYGKGQPYEESIRVPLVVVVPGIRPGKDHHLVVQNLDIGPTIFDLAGIEKRTDGLSLVPLLKNPEAPWRQEFLIENYGTWPLLTWSGLRTKNGEDQWKYVEYHTGEKELYDLKNDPYEMENRHGHSDYQQVEQNFAARLRKQKGLSISNTTFDTPIGLFGRPYDFQPKATGGIGRYKWKIPNEKLPNGLSFDQAKGKLSGLPLQAAWGALKFQVTDPAVCEYTGDEQSYTLAIGINITTLSGPYMFPLSGGGYTGFSDLLIAGRKPNSDKVSVSVLDVQKSLLLKQIDLELKRGEMIFSVSPSANSKTGSAYLSTLSGDEATGKITLRTLELPSGRVSRILPISSILKADEYPLLLHMDEKGEADPALLRKEDLNGAMQVEVWSPESGELVHRISFDGLYNVVNNAVKVPDLDGNGVPEIVLLGRNKKSHRVQAQIRDLATGKLVKNMFFFRSKYRSCEAMAVLSDFNNNGIPELAVLGNYLGMGTSNVGLVVRDLLTGESIREISFSGYNLVPNGAAVMLNEKGVPSATLAMQMRNLNNKSAIVLYDAFHKKYQKITLLP